MEDDYMGVYDNTNENPKSKCRLCAKIEPAKFLINIFGSDGRKYALDIKIRKCLPILVREDDGMPKGVCMTCVNKLDVSADLVESALQAHNSFLAVLAHDPARAKMERSTVLDDETSDNEDVSDVDIDQSSDTENLEADEMELPVVIKNEQIDLVDEVIEDLPSSEIQCDSPITLQDETQEIPPEIQLGLNTSSVNDGMSNVVVTSVNSISLEPTNQASTSVINPDDENLPIILSTSDSTQINKSGEQQTDDNSSTMNIRGMTIKEEPLGSPQRTYSPLTSESDQTMDTGMSSYDLPDNTSEPGPSNNTG